ncbi:glycosyltransferase [Campylobacter hyointestinalis]|uniref:glycosyltransferase n=1 Tax=Campylobacter hyointestinalis TaxID=198 RepID=UPI000CE53340|nr:glycosyltransferase [Campylobacter hyointestinalis]MBT0612382.1 glycosyltransferase [Campylobacter hyointestinalis subsp. hyointestinalis]MDY2998766.1 glycosyltransferase [Campylobacter hyointestinalis]PPB66829.1 hypothetical protein CDQ76_08195 [Campylobacter hyointestinalis subsp. hyointestinalis]
MKNYKILHILNDNNGGIKSAVANLVNLFPGSTTLNIETKDVFKVLYKFKKISANYDAVHFHGAWQLHILLSFFCQKPIIISPHGSFHPMGLKKSKIKKQIAKNIYVKFCYGLADCICALTKNESDYIRDFGIKDVPIMIIPNAIDFDLKLNINEIKKKELLNLANGRKIILSLCRLDPQKGLEMLIDSFKLLNDANIVLFIAGNGNENFTSKLRDKIMDLNLENHIFLLGYLSGANKFAAFSVSDVYVLPSFNEGFGMTILEAYRQKVPVITTTTTPFDDIEREQFGWYIEPNLESLYNALNDALHTPKKRLEKMGDMGAQFMRKRYSLNIIYKSYKKLYDEIIGK